ncbi:hypothetical protein SprV_0602136800 [Sparganum proliferum]
MVARNTGRLDGSKNRGNPGYAERNESKKLFAATKEIHDTPAKRADSLLSFDGSTLLMEKSQILKRSPKHSRSVLNRSFTISNTAVDRVSKVLMFSAMLMSAYRDVRLGIRIVYRTDRHLLNSRRMQTPPPPPHRDYLRPQSTICSSPTTAHSKQRRMCLFVAGCSNFGLTIKTEDRCHAPTVIKGLYSASRTNTRSKTVDNFVYQPGDLEDPHRAQTGLEKRSED